MKKLRHQGAAVMALFLSSNIVWTAWAQAKDCDACKTYSAMSLHGNGSTDSAGNALSLNAVIDPSRCGPIPKKDKDLSGAGTGSMFKGKQGQGSADSVASMSTIDKGIDVNFRSGDVTWDTCFAKWVESWNNLGQYCETQGKLSAAYDWNLVAAIAFTATAAICATSCGLHLGGVTSAAAAGFDWACAIADAASLGIMIKEEVDVGNVNDSYKAKYDGRGRNLGIVADAGPAASAVLTFIAMSSPEKAAVLSCIGAGVQIAAATAKWGSLVGLGKTADENCASAGNLITPTPGPSEAIGTIMQDTTVSNGNFYSNSGPGASGKGQGAGVKAPPSGSLPAVVEDYVNHPQDPKYAAATANNVGDVIYKKMTPDLLNIARQEAGINMKEIGKRLQSGQSPAQVAASLAPDFASTAADVEKALKDGKLVVPGISGGGIMSASRGGGAGVGKDAAKANPFGMLGIKGPGDGGGAPTEMVFDKVKRDLASSDASGDIFHEGFGGTIFQIVSGKLDKTHERIEQLEWDTPLNRALLGLPTRKLDQKAKR